jgi:hypothetical protein
MRIVKASCLIGVIAVAIFIVVNLLSILPAIDQTSYQKIEIGMSQEEVKLVIGGPPGDYTSPDWLSGYAIHLEPIGSEQVWQGDDAEIRVTFKDGKVSHKYMTILEDFFWDPAWGPVVRGARRATARIAHLGSRSTGNRKGSQGSVSPTR